MLLTLHLRFDVFHVSPAVLRLSLCYQQKRAMFQEAKKVQDKVFEYLHDISQRQKYPPKEELLRGFTLTVQADKRPL